MDRIFTYSYIYFKVIRLKKQKSFKINNQFKLESSNTAGKCGMSVNHLNTQDQTTVDIRLTWFVSNNSWVQLEMIC